MTDWLTDWSLLNWSEQFFYQVIKAIKIFSSSSSKTERFLFTELEEKEEPGTHLSPEMNRNDFHTRTLGAGTEKQQLWERDALTTKQRVVEAYSH